MQDLEIKKATIHDVNQLQKIGKQTFIETYASFNTEENLKAYLENNFSKKKLKTALIAQHSEFYFAILRNTIIGYLKINIGQPPEEVKDKNTIEIERIYVYAEYYGKKVGQALCEKAVKIAKEKKVSFLWLGVWEENQRAIHFYQKNGFTQFGTHVFKLGNDEQTDFLMKLQIN